MKNFIIFILIICTLLFSFCSCGNRAILDPGNFTYKHIHISDAVEGYCLNISKWWEGEAGIEVRTEAGNGIFCSEGTYQLFESASACPYC